MSLKDTKLSEDEIALYDRQIRLWGMAAQLNMRNARVLLINLGSIGAEVAKNIVLSGIGHLCILDDGGHTVDEHDLRSSFLFSREDLGKSRLEACKARIHALNPLVDLTTTDSESLDMKSPEYSTKFDLIVATELSKPQLIRLNKISRDLNIPLYVAGSNGLFAYIFVDLIEFESVETKLKSNLSTPLGKSSPGREIVEVTTYTDETDGKGKLFERITVRNTFKTLEEILESATLEPTLNKRQLKRVSNILPLTLATLSNESKPGSDLSLEELKQIAVSFCEKLKIPTTSLNDTYIEQFHRQRGLEFPPVSAIIGGAIAQDVINILGKRQSPINNFVVFDGITLEMPIFEL